MDPKSGTPTSTRDVEKSDSGSVAARSYGAVGNYLRAGRINLPSHVSTCDWYNGTFAG